MTDANLPSVVIVGGSVSGMTLALLLSQKKLASSITVLEKEKEVEDLKVPQAGSYVFRIARGNSELILSLFTPEERVSIEKDICADSDTSKAFVLNGKTGTVKQIFNPFTIVADGIHKNLFFRRRDLIQLLRQKVLQNKQIKVLYNTVMTGLKTDNDKHQIIVLSSHSKRKTLRANLVFGCDGMKSSVRKALAEIDPQQFQWIRQRMLSTGQSVSQ